MCPCFHSERGGEGSGGGVPAADGQFARWELHPDMAAPQRQNTLRLCGD